MFNIPIFIPLAVLIGIILIFVEGYVLRKINSLRAYINVMLISLALGLSFVLIGLPLNIAAVKANGGIMKVDIAVVQRTLDIESLENTWHNFYNKNDIRLYPLCDKFYCPNVLLFNGAFYSIGDIFLWIALVPLITVIPLDFAIYRRYLKKDK